MSDEEFKKYVERMFWEFDGLRKGVSGRGEMSEERAFEHIVRRVVGAVREHDQDVLCRNKFC